MRDALSALMRALGEYFSYSPSRRDDKAGTQLDAAIVAARTALETAPVDALPEAGLIESLQADHDRLLSLNELCAEKACVGCVHRQRRATVLQLAINALASARTEIERLRAHRTNRDRAVERKTINQRTEIRRLLANGRAQGLNMFESWKRAQAYWDEVLALRAELAQLKERA